MNLKDIFNMTGKTVLAVSGNSRLGQAMCEALAELGALVVITGRDLAKAEAAAEAVNRQFNRCVAEKLDVSSEAEVKAVFQSVKEKYGRIDVVLNNASYGVPGQLHEMPYADWKKGIDGTINGVFLTCTEAIRVMLAQGGGSIINVASMYGVVSPNPDIYLDTPFGSPASYGAGKAAIIQLTKYIAGYYGSRGIRANAISPGPFPNEAVQRHTEFAQRLARKTALGRIGSPDELKGVTALLASEAGSYITGENICIDGGWTAW